MPGQPLGAASGAGPESFRLGSQPADGGDPPWGSSERGDELGEMHGRDRAPDIERATG
jgi:hypothetical protein